MPEQDLAAQWNSFDAPRRQRLLARMSPEQKSNLRKILEGQGHTAGATAAADQTAAPAPPTQQSAATPRSLTERVSDFIDQKLPYLSPADVHAMSFPNETSQKAAEVLRPVANVVTRAIRDVGHLPAVVANSHPLDAARLAVQDNLHPIAAMRRHAADVQAQAQAANHPYDPTTRTGVLAPGQQPAKPTEQDYTDEAGDVLAQLGVAEVGGKVLGGVIEGARIVGDPRSAARMAAGKLPVPVTSGGLRRAAQTLTGTGEKAVENELTKVAGKAAEDRENVRAKNRAADERTLEKRGKVDEQNADGVQANAQKRLALIKENADAQRAHADAVQGVREHNAGVHARRQQLQETQGRITAASRQLDEKIQAAKQSATGENNANWQAVREKTGEEEGDISDVKRAVKVAARQADPQGSPVFKSILKEDGASPGPSPDDVRGYNSMYPAGYPNRPSFDDWHERVYGAPPPIDGSESGNANFDRLHRWYSYVSNQMYGGSRLDGHLYKGLSSVRDALNTAMQGIAERTGATADLGKARESHTNLMETFSDSPNVQQTNASKSLQETNPEYVKQQQQQARMDMLARYDPEIESLSNHVKNLRDGADALSKGPNEFKDIPAKPELKALPEFEGHSYSEPEAQQPFEQPRVNLQQMRADMLNRATKKWSDISQYKIRRLSVSAIGGLATWFGTHSGEAASLTTSAMYGMSEFAPNLVSSIVNKPAVLEWLTKPTLDDIDTLQKIPHGDLIKITDAMTDIAAERARRGQPVKLAPQVQKLLGARNLAVLNAAQRAMPMTAGDAKARVADVDSGQDPTVDSDSASLPYVPPPDYSSSDQPEQ